MVWGIATNEPESHVRTYVEQLGLTFPILLDPNGSVHQNYQQRNAFPSAAYPQDWVIGAKSEIIYVNNGFELDAMRTAVESQFLSD